MPESRPDQLRQILESVRTIALVGASEKPHRDSHSVMAFLQGRGYRVIPVNPRLAGGQLLGETVYPNITSIPDAIDMADLFLASRRVGPIVDEAIRKGVGVVWMQIGVIDEEAAQRAEDAGLKVVMDRCPKQEIPRLGVPLATA
ncbi:CoA-binding protein [Marinobacter nanhaiticus D15-8W]|uniref:CoA-binding protein n=1 Tax=Marinobacter nanhaiticus D15-8W TaxID=626887 RepID=N6W5C2_9GAMM|nr:CoA-binding protein [Marinobacter nanhaiticus]ENO15414.1 CoA-binding protein [Marinobacter nanhaiticus D15-8W]BES73737.1 CoA-binding protein [Marinobacter nanhaiticus D15-8W]